MPEFARIEGDQVVERRYLEDIPEHKAHIWRPVVIEGRGDVLTTIVELGCVRLVSTEVPLDDLKRELRALVDADAEAVWGQIMTPGAGIANAYRQKAEQATAVLEMGHAVADALPREEAVARFPALAASIGLDAPTLSQCAELVSARASAAEGAAHDIEHARLAGKSSIAAAADHDAARAAFAAIIWPLAGGVAPRIRLSGPSISGSNASATAGRPDAVSDSVEDLRRQVAALALLVRSAAPAATPATLPSIDDDMPAFLKRFAPQTQSGPAAPPPAPVDQPAPAIDQRVQDQIDDLWSHLREEAEDRTAKPSAQGQIDDICMSLSDLWAHIREVDAARARDIPPEPRVVPPPLPVAPSPDHSGAIADLTEWLSRIETLARSAKETADAVAARPVAPVAAPVAVPPQPVISARDRAILDIRAASAARRAALIGETADERDVRQRLAEVALNARGSHQPSIDLLMQMSPSMGMPWGEAATMLAAEHDVANRVALETLALETVAVSEISTVGEAGIGAALARFMNAIEGYGR